MENMDTAARATGVEDNGVRGRGLIIGGHLAVREGVVFVIRRHEVENKRDE